VEPITRGGNGYLKVEIDNPDFAKTFKLTHQDVIFKDNIETRNTLSLNKTANVTQVDSGAYRLGVNLPIAN
jgi:hypothetical protein